MPKTKFAAPWVMIFSILMAMLAGPFLEKGSTLYSLLDTVGSLFINALTFVVVPLVSSSIITGIAKMGAETSFGKLGLKTLGFYLSTSLIAIVIGVFMVNLIQPGTYYNPLDVATLPSGGLPPHTDTPFDLSTFAKQIIPPNLFEAFASGGMLGFIFFSILFGYALSKIESESAKTLLQFWKGLFHVMIQIAQMILKFLPIGVFCLVAKSFASTGVGSITPLLLFSLTVLLSLSLFMFVALPLLLLYVGKVSPINHFRAMMPALVTAFSTSSSSASIPITLECVEKRAGVSRKISSLVIPLGTSINLSGSALYECVAAIFVAQAYGIDLPLISQIAVLLLALFASAGAAGVPAGSLVATIIIMKAIGLPAEGISLFLAVDRFMDMARTTVNIFSDSTCAVLVAATEGEKNLCSPLYRLDKI